MIEAPGLPRSTTARLLIVDDHELARAGLRSMLSEERGLSIVGEAVSGREALELCRSVGPDLVLMDVRMPDMDGLEATRAIKQECTQTSVIVVTMHEDPDYLYKALQAGAAGYVLKNATKRDLLQTIRSVLRGEPSLSPELASTLLKRLATAPKESPGGLGNRLTRRECEVLRLLAEGKTNREIAKDLVLSPGTVKVHVEHIIGKLDVSDRTQAAVRGVQLGLVSPS